LKPFSSPGLYIHVGYRRRSSVLRVCKGGVAVGGSGYNVGQRWTQRRLRRRPSDTPLSGSLWTSETHHWILTPDRRPDGAQHRHSFPQTVIQTSWIQRRHARQEKVSIRSWPVFI